MTMKVRHTLVLEPADRPVRSSVLVPSRRRRGRPERTYTLRIGSPRDVTEARRTGIPLHLVSPELVSTFGFPMTFRPTLVIWDELAEVLETPYPVQTFRSRKAAQTPRIEDLIIALLKIDVHAARAVGLRNPEFVNPARLLIRVVEENVEREATEVELQDLAPAIPRDGPSIPRHALEAQDRNNLSIGLL